LNDYDSDLHVNFLMILFLHNYSWRWGR